MFTRQADKLFSDEERKELIDSLAEHPAAGDEIPGTGGVRKLRFAAMGRGKRGGARVIYFYGGGITCRSTRFSHMQNPPRLI